MAAMVSLPGALRRVMQKRVNITGLIDLTTLQDPWFILMVQTSQGILGTTHPVPFLSTWDNKSWIA